MSETTAIHFKPEEILVSGTGKMGKAILNGIAKDEGHSLLPYAISLDPADVALEGMTIKTVAPEHRDTLFGYILPEQPFLLIDAVPAAGSQANAEYYSQYKEPIPVIMMSTGITHPEKIKNTLILPNACLPIVAFEEFLKSTKINFSHRNYTLEIFESHQSSKEDVSGTACKFVPYFNRWGLNFTEQQITKTRNEQQQRLLGIPEKYLWAHAFHRYTIESPFTSDDLLHMLYVNAKAFFTTNPVFEQLFMESFEDSGMPMISWRNHPNQKNATFSFSISARNTERGSCFEVIHKIFAHQPYVDGITTYTIPFMQDKCIDGLTGDNFSSLDLYAYATKK